MKRIPKNGILTPCRLLVATAVTGLMLTRPASAVTLTLTTTPPEPGIHDVYNFEGAINDDANVGNGNDANTYVAGDRATQGQTFTTGANPSGYVLTDVWIRHAG